MLRDTPHFQPRKGRTPMDLTSYLTSAGMAMAQVRNGQSIGLAVAKKAMDTQQTQAQGLMELMDAAPTFGHSMDIRI